MAAGSSADAALAMSQDGRAADDATPTISIVIPTWNGEAHLAEQLESLAVQGSETSFEVVIADNGSTDRTLEIARSFDGRLDLHVVDAAARRGQTFARNTGVRAARAERILFLDQDDATAPGYIDAMVRALARGELVAAGIDTRSLNAGWRADVRTLAQTDELPQDMLPWAYGCTLGVTRRAFELVGGFDTSLRVSGEDIDLCWRLHAAGVPLSFVPEAVLRYRFPDTNARLFAQGRRYGRGQAAVNRKHRSLVRHRLTFVAWCRRTLGALRLALLPRAPGDRGRGLFLLGRRLGMLEGGFRRGT
jgi:GT2 family glycosyltransferase